MFPDVPITIENMEELANHEKRQGFLKCWEEMQKDKQTCGFCVEPKQKQKEPLYEVNTDSAINMGRTLSIADYNPRGYSFEEQLGQSNQLREAAEEAVSAFYNHSLCGELLKKAVLKLEKALK